jgi:hypothetical protein
MAARKPSLAALLLALLLPSLSPAQEFFPIVRQVQASAWRPGSWAEYAVHDARSRATSRMLVGVFQEKDGSRWMEVTSEGEGSMRFPLFDGYAYAMQGGRIIRLWKAGEFGGSGEVATPAPRGVILRLETRAGAFDCRRFDLKDGIYWLSDQVPGIAVVKAKLADGGWVELLAHGRSARSAFPEGFQRLARDLALPISVPAQPSARP